MRRKEGRERIRPYIPSSLKRRVEEMCLRRNVTESAFVTLALEQALDGVSDVTLLFRRLDRHGRALEHVQRSVDFSSEAFAGFLRSWFVYTPPIAPNDTRRQAAARATADERYRQLMAFIVKRFREGPRFIDDLPQEPVADVNELDAVRAQADKSAKPVGLQ